MEGRRRNIKFALVEGVRNMPYFGFREPSRKKHLRRSTFHFARRLESEKGVEPRGAHPVKHGHARFEES